MMYLRSLVPVLLLTAATTATDFGQNKVQYTDLQWRYINAPHLKVYYHQDQGDLPRTAARWSEEIYASLRQTFRFTHRQQVPLIIYASPGLFQQTNVIMELVPEEVGGFTELFKNRVVVPFTGSYQDFRHVLNHEMVHAFEFGILYDEFAGAILRNANLQIPLWFAEGLAEYLSTDWDAEADMFLMDQAVFGELPSADLNLGGYMVYKGGQSFLTYLAESRGPKRFDRFLRAFKENKSVQTALERAYGPSQEDLANGWIRELKRLYWPEIGRRQDPAALAKPLTSHIKNRNHYNLRPRISPDGTRIAYFSDRKDDTRIVIADRSGKTVREITQYGYGGYFESFHPFRSGLCWSPDGGRIAFVTKRNGRDEVRIVRTDTWKTERTVRIGPEYLSSPDWSPDGERIVLCGLTGDKTDLYAYRLPTGETSRLTSSTACETDPRFSPDGRSVVFAASDTLGAGPASLRRQSLTHLYRLDLATRAIEQLTHSSNNETQPCFSGDSARILYVSDRNGINNLYIAPLSAPDSCLPLTDIIGGCSNPDWSRNDSTVAFCLFQKQGWDIWWIDEPLSHLKSEDLAPTQWRLSQVDTTVKFFTPVADTSGDSGAPGIRVDTTASPRVSADTADLPLVEEEVADTAPSPAGVGSNTTDSATLAGVPESDSALPAAVTKADSASPGVGAAGLDSGAAARAAIAPSLPYRLKFSADMVAVGLAINSLYGNYGGQGVVVLSDVLGNHRITLAGDIQGRLDEYAHIYASYLSLQHRLDFGIAGFFSRDYTWQSLADTYHDTNIGGLLMASYPFSRAMRLDFNAYYSNLSRELLGDPGTDDSGARVPDRWQYNILLPSLSVVFDNIVWGITGPVNGIRANANLLVAPPLPSSEHQFIAGELDFRKYFHFARRFVWANRLAVGASQSLDGGESARRYFLGGNENWLFLYDDIDVDNYVSSLPFGAYSEIVVPFRGWKFFGLTGTRYAVVNSEFRFPFIKNIAVVWPLPFEIRYINGAVFVDAGNAWDREDQFPAVPLPHDIFGGIGFGFRANLGIFVVRFDRAWRTDWQTYLGHPRSYLSLGAEF